MHRGADALCAVDGDTSPHHLHQIFADGQPETSALVFPGEAVVGLREGLKQGWKYRIIDADSSIGHREEHPNLVRGRTRQEGGLNVYLPGLSEFDGIADQVVQHLLKPGTVAHHVVRDSLIRIKGQADAFLACRHDQAYQTSAF